LASAATGAFLVPSKSADAQQQTPNGFAQVDVINFLLNIKYLKATLYSYATQGTDLPPASQVTLGTGGVYNVPSAAVKFSNQQITDLFNEMYYDELNQLIALRALQGVAVIGRPTINLLGTGPSGSVTGLSATTAFTQAQVISLAQFFEDLSVTAFANAAIYLTGTNLDLCMQAMATDSFHSGAIRLLAIQTGAPYNYQGTASFTFTAGAIAGSNIIYAFLTTASPVQVGYTISTGATTPVTGDTNVNGGAGSPGYASVASLSGLAGVATVTAVGAIPSSYSSGYTTASTSHHLNELTDVPAAVAQTWQPGMPAYDSGGYFVGDSPLGVYIVSIVPNPSPATTYTVTFSASSGGHTPGTIYVGTTAITLSAPFPNSGVFTASTIGFAVADPDSVLPADIGPGVATTGPALNPKGLSASVLNQGFFDTSGAAASSATSTPPGFAFARTFQQVLTILLNYNPSNPTVTQSYEGGFFPEGVGGNITSVI
jgi:hypothetical protein